MRLLLLLVVFLVGCATAPTTAIDGQAQAARGGATIVVGTLAPLNTFEWDVAPLYSRVAVARAVAARRVQQGTLSTQDAREVQALANEARRVLDAAVAQEARDRNRAAATAATAPAVTALDRINSVMRKSP